MSRNPDSFTNVKATISNIKECVIVLAERDMTKERAYYSAGYLIVAKRNREEWMDDEILPTKVVSASNCICDSYPHAWGFPNSWRPRGGDVYTISKAIAWPSGPKPPGRDEIIGDVKDKLNLDRRSFSKLQKWVKKQYKAKNIEFPNVFLSLNIAREFHRTYLKHIPDLELIGMGFSRETIDKYRKDEKRDQMWMVAQRRLLSEIPDAMVFTEERLEKYMPDERSFEMKESDFLKILVRYEPIDSSGIMLGFEILGDEGCYNFHSHICNSYEMDLKKELGVTFNENGFIDSYEDANRSTRYIEQDEDSEPVDWYPCLIARYEFH
ncbi:MAG: hypothetical protein ACE5IO_07165 [Thermoplasmata archaeon]